MDPRWQDVYGPTVGNVDRVQKGSSLDIRVHNGWAFAPGFPKRIFIGVQFAWSWPSSCSCPKAAKTPCRASTARTARWLVVVDSWVLNDDLRLAKSRDGQLFGSDTAVVGPRGGCPPLLMSLT
jgi:hypothetical protein